MESIALYEVHAEDSNLWGGEWRVGTLRSPLRRAGAGVRACDGGEPDRQEKGPTDDRRGVRARVRELVRVRMVREA